MTTGLEGTGAPVRSVARALLVLSCFDDDHPDWTLAALARETGLPKSTLVRILATLASAGMVWPRPDGRIAAGAGLLRWAGLARSTWDVTQAAVQQLEDTARACQESVSLYVRQGLTRVVVARAEGPRSLRHVVRVGEVLPLTSGAASWVLLAHAPDRVVADVGSAAPAGRDVRALADRARRRGVAVSHGEREDGVSGVAVPVEFGPAYGGTRVMAALAVGGPTTRFDDRAVGRFTTVLQGAAENLGSQLLSA